MLGARSAVSGAGSGVLGLVGLLVGGLFGSLAAASSDPLLPESARPIPGSLAGPFGSTGFGIGYGGTIAVLAIMFGSYVLAVRGAGDLSPRAVLAAIAALDARVLLAPPLPSSDVFSYQ